MVTPVLPPVVNPLLPLVIAPVIDALPLTPATAPVLTAITLLPTAPAVAQALAQLGPGAASLASPLVSYRVTQRFDDLWASRLQACGQDSQPDDRNTVRLKMTRPANPTIGAPIGGHRPLAILANREASTASKDMIPALWERCSPTTRRSARRLAQGSASDMRTRHSTPRSPTAKATSIPTKRRPILVMRRVRGTSMAPLRMVWTIIRARATSYFPVSTAQRTPITTAVNSRRTAPRGTASMSVTDGPSSPRLRRCNTRVCDCRLHRNRRRCDQSARQLPGLRFRPGGRGRKGLAQYCSLRYAGPTSSVSCQCGVCACVGWG